MNSPRKRAKDNGLGMKQDNRGQGHLTDKERAQQLSDRDPATGEEAQRNAAVSQPQSPGQPAGGE